MPIYAKNYMDDEEEIQDLQTQTELETPQPELPKEEQTWKKRYGDLRRLDQTKDNEIKALKAQLEQASKRTFNAPNADDEAALEEWANTYPDIARVVTTLANRQARQQMEEVDRRVKAFEEDKFKDLVATAQKKLAEAHPDFFDTIRVDPEFEAWIASKPKRMQDALYSDESVTDWQSAADVITLYKFEKGLIDGKKSKPTDTRRQAITDVPTRNKTQPKERQGYDFLESEIEKMPYHVYEQNEQAILKAMKEGKVLMDKTGGAR